MTQEEMAARLLELTPTLYRICCAELRSAADREDAVQETLLTALEKRHALRDERAMKAWLVRILISRCRDIQRRARREVPRDALPERAWERPEGVLVDAVRGLEERLRLPVMLHYIEGFDVRQTAAILRIPPGTVKSRLYKARQALRRQLDEEVFEP